MTTQHTPGPWIVGTHDGHATFSITGPQGKLPYIAQIPSDRAERAANARLIAAAPDLLLHLQRLVRAIDRAPANFADGLADEARAAIARATA